MPSSLLIEGLVLITLVILFVLAGILGVIDRGRAADRGFSLLTAGGFLVVLAWVLLALNWHQGWGEYYLRYGYLGALPVFVLFGHCLWEPVFWDWYTLFFGLAAVIVLALIGFLFWPFWVLGFVVSLWCGGSD